MSNELVQVFMIVSLNTTHTNQQMELKFYGVDQHTSDLTIEVLILSIVFSNAKSAVENNCNLLDATLNPIKFINSIEIAFEEQNMIL